MNKKENNSQYGEDKLIAEACYGFNSQVGSTPMKKKLKLQGKALTQRKLFYDK